MFEKYFCKLYCKSEHKNILNIFDHARKNYI